MTNKRSAIPLWFKIAYTAMVAVIDGFYIFEYGPVNFLWFSNIAMLSVVLIAWLEWRLLATMQLIGVALLEMIWTLDFIIGLALGDSAIGLTAYMFDEQIPMFLRILSLYHILLPWILLWLVWRLGYDERGWWAQTVFGWLILLLTYVLTDPLQNVNWVFGLREEQAVMPPGVYLAIIMVAYPLAVYLPSHVLFRWMMGKIGKRK